MPAQKSPIRLAQRETEIIDRTKTVDFTFDGKPIQAYKGDTVASALYASGVRIFSRSFKYHRPRGLLCAGGNCPNCLMTVDGVPNVRACTEKAKIGMSVQGQNAWPSIEHDFFSILDKFSGLMPVGFYYKVFHRPKFLWNIVQPLIKRIAGLGKLEVNTPPETQYTQCNYSTDVAIVGGGPSGLSAALAACKAGAKVTLIDDQDQLGGHLRWEAQTIVRSSGFSNTNALGIAKELSKAVHDMQRIDVLSNATVFGLYQDNLLGITTDDKFVKLRAKNVIIATGSQDVPLVFERNDLPGVMLTDAALKLINLYGLRPGTKAVIATNDDKGYLAALEFIKAGTKVAVLVDSRPDFPHGMEAAEALKASGTLILPSHALVLAEGSKKVIEAIVAKIVDGEPTSEERRFDCDVICTSSGGYPTQSLLQMAGANLNHDPVSGKMVIDKLPEGVYAAGEVTGRSTDIATSIAQGEMVGANAAGGKFSVIADDQPHSEILSTSGYRTDATHRSFICFCEDITDYDVNQAIEEGFDDIQTLKRYSTVTMGPCQGKMCHKSLVESAARQTNRSMSEIGTTTSRPPFKPVSLGALAGASHMPIKRTPLHQIHNNLDAKFVDLGPWRRPFTYTSPHEECQTVRERVGIIDVSSLGKLKVEGSDAGALLDKVYTHHFSDLGVGRIRYGLLCADNGTIMDDGTVGRLANESYFVTTTTGNIELIEDWFKWWSAGANMCVHYTNVTSTYAAINLAGPKARETLAKLTDTELGPSDFRYMRIREANVAGVGSLLLRIGFVGESGWEIHFPAEYGEHMWNSLMEAGEEFGIGPFGLEAQRILRLEKKHIIVGQDTDAISNPLESDMEWAVRFDKEDFIGRGGLTAVQKRGLKNKLVGFTMADKTVPDDGDPIVIDGMPVGRVTSSRLSPSINKGFGLMWVPIDLANDGNEVHIRVDGKNLNARVTTAPTYDPKGTKLRE